MIKSRLSGMACLRHHRRQQGQQTSSTAAAATEQALSRDSNIFTMLCGSRCCNQCLTSTLHIVVTTMLAVRLPHDAGSLLAGFTDRIQSVPRPAVGL
jgi:hypothetical protein